MRIRIDPDNCIASGACRLAAPTVFDQDEDGVVVLLTPTPPEEARAAALAAAIACPAAVISIEED